MNPLPILLILTLAVAGCLGSAPESPEPGTDEAGPGIEEPGVRDPAAGAPINATDRFPLEGTGCAEDHFDMEIPVERVRPHVPPGRLDGTDSTTFVRIGVFACDSATLADGSFRTGVHLFMLDVLLDGTEEEVNPFYLMEAATDWPPLLELVAATDTPSHLVTFTTSDDDAGRSIHIVGGGIDYLLQSPLHQPQEMSASDSERLLHAGPEGEGKLRFVIHRGASDGVFTAGIVEADGGVLGAATEGTWPGKHRLSEVAILLNQVQ